ncbi:hypothetical protein [Streptomyces sp. IBSBF 3136]|uniref:hypothetical protein n=1 Tax=Streptomyces sp. IBSBF 3136 TaxID=2903524 RepID=UPI002FDBD8C6
MSYGPSPEKADGMRVPGHHDLQAIHAAVGTTVFATAHGDMHIWDGNLAHAFTPYANGDHPTSRPGPVKTADPLLAELTDWREAPEPDGATAPVPGVSLLTTATGADLDVLTTFLRQSRAAGWAVWTALPRSPGTPSATASIPAASTGRALVWVPATPSWTVSDLGHLVTDPVLRIGRYNRVLLHAHSPDSSSDPDPGMTWWPALRNRLRKSGATDIRTLRCLPAL